MSILVDGAEEEEAKEAPPPCRPPQGGRRRPPPCRDCKDASHWIIDIHEGMEEAAHLFLVSLLHAAWRHGRGEDGYC